MEESRIPPAHRVEKRNDLRKSSEQWKGKKKIGGRTLGFDLS